MYAKLVENIKYTSISVGRMTCYYNRPRLAGPLSLAISSVPNHYQPQTGNVLGSRSITYFFCVSQTILTRSGLDSGCIFM